MDLFETPDLNDNAPIYSVSEVSGALKKTVEGAFSNIRIRGEIGRVSRPASGHVYLDIKDDKAVINCNLWKGVANRIGFLPEEGMEVIAQGKLSTYAPQSKYNFIIESLEIAGEGALMALLEKRKKALAAEGLFANERKQELPFLPKRIGVITSRSGAVIKDILHRIQDRFPAEVILWPVTVQGDKCATEVSNAIRGFNKLDRESALYPDVLIVARGGGSIEDLWGFNEEVVARAVFESKIPIISAVGHETDTTLIDYVADKRAPTPSAAAEIVVPVKSELNALIAELELRRQRSMVRIKEFADKRVRDLGRSLMRSDQMLGVHRQRLDHASIRLSGGLDRRASLARESYSKVGARLSARNLARLAKTQRSHLDMFSQRLFSLRLRAHQKSTDQLIGLARLLQSVSHKRVIARGFALIKDSQGRILTSHEMAQNADKILIEQVDGITTARPIKE